jgi:hypothetical protein
MAAGTTSHRNDPIPSTAAGMDATHNKKPRSVRVENSVGCRAAGAMEAKKFAHPRTPSRINALAVAAVADTNVAFRRQAGPSGRLRVQSHHTKPRSSTGRNKIVPTINAPVSIPLVLHRRAVSITEILGNY